MPAPKPETPKLVFPRLRELTLNNFTLYALKKDTLTVSFNDGVFCLAGANGLGKSTFLNAVNFGLTGRVPSPEEKFTSVEEYFKATDKFAAEYFDGRIEERDREVADVSILMDVGTRTYFIRRNLFESDSLEELRITRRPSGNKKEVVDVDAGGIKGPKRDELYKKELISDIGVATFEQFVFLQHFVFTFDERRHLLFWNQKELEQALYLAFGLNFEEATEAGNARREMEKADSLARNLKWNQYELTKRINELKGAKGPEADVELRQKYMSLLRQRDTAAAATTKIDADLRDQTIKLTNFATKQVEVRAEYDELFNARFHNHLSLRSHPLIVSSNEQEKCGLCGTEGKAAIAAINLRVKAANCPLCSSSVQVSKGKDTQAIKRLQELDKSLMEIGAKMQDTLKASARLKSESQQVLVKQRTAIEKLDKFEQQNAEVLASLKNGSDTSLATTIASFEKRLAELDVKRQKELTRRDKAKASLRQLRGRLVEKYRLAEKNFVPAFKKLAEDFLGLQIDVRIAEESGTGVGLVIDVRSSARKKPHKLSESQRLFVDIALRMALAQHISEPTSRATLFVDTPEGSLDIAYENRAGMMMANFALAGNPIIMTANINTSRLLQVLAEKLRSKHMTVCRMTAWAELSDVQVAEERLFTAAFRQIEQRLKA